MKLHISYQRRVRETPKTMMNDVVSYSWCESDLPAEDNMGKNRMEELHTYAELNHDLRASLPDSFTVSSTILIPKCPNYVWPTFFTILDNNGAQFLAPVCSSGSIESQLKIYYLQGSSESTAGEIPSLFPNKWTRSCMAINTTSGLINWVIEGTHVLTTTSEEVKNQKKKPKNLSKKLVLGARSYAGIWFVPSQKVTDLNIFSTALSIEKGMTEGASCIEEGDYLAWGDMEWILHGQASIETVDKEDPCKGEPYVDLFHTPFQEMDTCMHHCENLGTRVPSLTTPQDWASLQRYLNMNLSSRG